MRQTSTILIALIALLLVGCSQATYEQMVGASVERSTVFSPFSPASSGAAIDDTVTGDKVKVVVSGNTSFANRTVTIYGVNSSSVASSESLIINGSLTPVSSQSWNIVSKIVLNASIQGTVVISGNSSGNVIATLPSGNTSAYNQLSFNGTNWAVPGLGAINQSDVDLRFATEYVLYMSCGVINAGTNLSVVYYVSPDGVKWFNGAVSVAGCNNTAAKTTLTDAGVGYLRLQVTNGATLPNQEYIKLIYK